MNPPAPPDYQPNHHTLLLVHGDDAIAAALRQCLDKKGYEVVTVIPAKDFPQRLANPDIALLFIGISPPSEDSFTLCQYVKTDPTTRHVPIIIIGQGEPSEIAQAFAAHADDYVTWPCHGEELHARIQNQLSLSQRRKQLSQQNALLLDEVRERKQIEDTLRQTEAKYRSIFENATEGIFQTSEAGRYLHVNPALAQIYGYDSPQDLMDSVRDVGKQLYVQPKRRDELVAYLKQFGKITGAESEVLRKDGSRIWVSETLHRAEDADDNFLYYEGTVHDITEQRSMEMELRKQRQQADRL